MVSNFRFPLPSLTLVIETLQRFQTFSPLTRASAIALYAAELAAEYGWQQEVAELHLYSIAALLSSDQLTEWDRGGASNV